MTPHLVWTALPTVLALASVLGCLALGVAFARLRSAQAETRTRLDALATRVSRVEAASEPENIAPPRQSSLTSRVDPVAGASADFRGARINREPSRVAPTLICVPDLAVEDATAGRPTDIPRPDGRYNAVWDMAGAGAPAEAIAMATGQPIGQVELILGLSRRLSARAGPNGGGHGGSRTP